VSGESGSRHSWSRSVPRSIRSDGAALRINVDILGLAQGGEGIARAGGRTVFVPFTAPGDRVVAEVAPGEGVAHAALVEVLDPGPDRITSPCRHFGPAPGDRCGGCEWLHLSYAVQLEAKARAFVETLRRVGRLEPGSYPLRPIVASPSPLRYRSRAKFHLDRRAGRLVFFQRRSHEAVLVESCHLLEPELDALRGEVGPALARVKLEAREVLLEWSRHDAAGAAWIQLGSIGQATRTRAETLLRDVPALRGIVLTAEGAPVAIEGDPLLRLERRPGSPDAGLQRSRPDVFQQANRGGNARLVELAVELLEPRGKDVLELFCGAGNFTGPLAESGARSVAAVERQGPSLDLARRDLEGRNVRFFAGDALALARAFARERGPEARRFGRALLDPPREGARGVGPALRDLGVPRVVYVSCDPATLARDVRELVQCGYRLAAVQPVDMFPQTHHVEAVVLLESP
jgi:23S rRNA (uracil1939-C5)-methyltransferase